MTSIDDEREAAMSECSFGSQKELVAAFADLRRRRTLHPIVGERLRQLLTDIYPDAYSKPEPGEMPGGRPDLSLHFPNGLYAVFELFASASQVPQDLRHLEQSGAVLRMAIVVDEILDKKVFNEFIGKRPRDSFPFIRLSEVLVRAYEAATKEKLRRAVEEAFASSRAASSTSASDVLDLAMYDENSRRLVSQLNISIPTKPPDDRKLVAEAAFRLYLCNTGPRMARFVQIEMFARAHFFGYPYATDPFVIEESNRWAVSRLDRRTFRCRFEGGEDFVCHREGPQDLGVVRILIPQGEADGGPVKAQLEYHILAEGHRGGGTLLVNFQARYQP